MKRSRKVYVFGEFSPFVLLISLRRGYDPMSFKRRRIWHRDFDCCCIFSFGFPMVLNFATSGNKPNDKMAWQTILLMIIFRCDHMLWIRMSESRSCSHNVKSIALICDLSQTIIRYYSPIDAHLVALSVVWAAGPRRDRTTMLTEMCACACDNVNDKQFWRMVYTQRAGKPFSCFAHENVQTFVAQTLTVCVRLCRLTSTVRVKSKEVSHLSHASEFLPPVLVRTFNAMCFDGILLTTVFCVVITVVSTCDVNCTCVSSAVRHYKFAFFYTIFSS